MNPTSFKKLTSVEITDKFMGELKLEDHGEEAIHENLSIDSSIKIADLSAAIYSQYDTKVYKCPHCEFSTTSKRDLKYHSLTHKKNARIYQCDFCDFITIHSNVIDAHKLKHMRSDEIVWYECKICTFRAKFKGNLDKHELTHKVTHEQKR